MGEAAEVGQTANNYQILARLATGGMAEIFLARGVSATGVERYCVLKRILRNRASDVGFVRMFLDEARLAAQLQHPNVAQVYDIGKLGDSYFFTMEYVHGETVRAIMQRARSLRRELPLASILTIAAGAAAGLHHAHDRIGIEGRPLNIVHRDVSPSNLMVSYEGTVKVVDFGVAKASDRASETRSGTVKGKISYLSPEQARGTAVDRRSDLFSLGIVLWELLTSERLFKRASDFENMTAIVNEPTPAPSTRRKWIPPELDAISLKLLAKDPKERFQNADDLIEALERFASRSGTMISSSALSRFLRDMFGQRPEPWVEMDTLEVPEGITVTSEPIPGELAIPVEDDMDLQLSNVPKLERDSDDDRPHVTAAGRTHRMPTSQPREDQIPTTPHPKVANPLLTTLDSASPPPPRATPLPPAALGAAAFVPRTGDPRQTIAGTGPQSSRSSGPQTPISGPHATRGSAPSLPNEPSEVVHPRAVPLASEPRPSRIGWQLVIVVAIAAVVGSLTMWFVMKGRGSSDARATDALVATASVDAAVPLVTEDAAEPVVEVDAAVAVVEPPADAAEVVEVDASVAVAPKIEKKPEIKKPKKSEIATAWDSEAYKDVVARCTKAFPSNGDDQSHCVLAACNIDAESKARTFLGKVDRSKRKTLAASCLKQGVDLSAPKPDKPVEKPIEKPKKDPCEEDPMSCQH